MIRWGTWLQAAEYYAKYLQEIEAIVDTFESRESVHICKAKSALYDTQLFNDLEFITTFVMYSDID